MLKTWNARLRACLMLAMIVVGASVAEAQVTPSGTALVLGTGDLGIPVPTTPDIAQAQTYSAYKDGSTTRIVLKGHLCEAGATTGTSVCWVPLAALTLTAKHTIAVTAAVVAIDGEVEGPKVTIPFTFLKVAGPVNPVGTGFTVKPKLQ